MKKNIAIFTSARSEYGLLKPLIDACLKSDQFNTLVLVGGGHFSVEQGYTVNEIIADGVQIAAEFPFLVEDPRPTRIARSNALLQLQLAEYFEEHELDLIIVLGDRSELISVVSSALFQSIPIAHISGGEITEGATDNQVRHAVTKMSHIHFPATESYKKNILSMGEEEWRICVSGEPGLDHVLSLELPSKEDFLKKFSLPEDRKIILATLHSETISQTITASFIEELVDFISNNTEYHLLFTAANTDIGGAEINAKLLELSKANNRLTYVKSLGKTNYYAALKYTDLVIGNSSSGLVEAQSFNVPVLNIGDRQKGRMANPNVLDVSVSIEDIKKAIVKVSSENFKEKYVGQPNIYGDGNASNRIVTFLENLNWDQLISKKSIFP